MNKRLAAFAWGVTGVNVLVILWGAVVRATGSGAGCGSHWPSCNGEIVPINPGVETTIEFVHRLTSGLALILVFALLIWAWRSYENGHRVRNAAIASTVFIIIEALVGAGLVLFELTADNASVARGIVIALHLANTLLLLGALTLTAWWAGGAPSIDLKASPGLTALMLIGLGAVLFLGMSGAVTALGDTLFPVSSLSDAMIQELSPAAQVLIQLRVVHPIASIAAAAYIFFLVMVVMLRSSSGSASQRLAAAVAGMFLVQLLAGTVNIILAAPVWMQVIHLLLADVLWILLVLMTAATLQERPVEQAGIAEVAHPGKQQLPSVSN